jgi:hypothetical protein
MTCIPPIDPVVAALFHDSCRDAEIRADNEKRTTLHAPAGVIRTLKEIALICDCSMNDLFSVGIADLLLSVGLVPKLTIKHGLREKLARISDKSSALQFRSTKARPAFNSETDT